MSYIGNEQQWKRLIEVDWLGQYVKAWVAFNAWYRNNFNLKRDGEIIEEIKNDEGNICSKIENFLSGSSLDHKLFQASIADLHNSLSETIIKSNNKNISFTTIEDYKHAKPVEEKRYETIYKVEIDPQKKERIVTVKNTRGEVIFSKTIKSAEESQIDDGWYDSLSKRQKQILKGFLDESTPFHNLITSSNDCLEIEGFRFINNANLIARAIITTLYQLRNSLFHGEITPNSEAQRVYQPAYLILKSIIPGA